MATRTRDDIVKFVSASYKSEVIREIIDEVFWAIQGFVQAGDRVELRGFGVFRERSGYRRAVNGAIVGSTQVKRGVTFKPAKHFYKKKNIHTSRKAFREKYIKKSIV